jgi:hypothetical protein
MARSMKKKTDAERKNSTQSNKNSRANLIATRKNNKPMGSKKRKNFLIKVIALK